MSLLLTRIMLSVRERFVRVVGVRRAVDRNRHAVLEREPPVPRDVVGMRVRLEHADEPQVVPLRGVQVLLDPERGIDHHRFAERFVADEIRRAAEILVDELPADHGRDRSSRPR